MSLGRAVVAVDIGSTAVKGVVLGRDGRIWAEHQVAIETHTPQPGHAEQSPQAWWSALEQICHAWSKAGVPLGRLAALVMCGQMQDVVLSRGGRPVGPALLYSDGRATREADEVEETLGDVAALTGNPHTAASVLPKLLWLRRYAPEQLSGRPRLHVGAKDLLIEQLTGEHVTDHTTAATTGLYDLRAARWHGAWPGRLGLDLRLPALRWPGESAGPLRPEVAHLLGVPARLPVLTGLGDAGATTLGAGVGFPGGRYAYLGTSGWLGTVVQDLERPATGFRLPLLGPGSALAVDPLTNVGSAHRWAAKTFAGGDYRLLETLMERADPSDLLCLPYLAGERSPVQDPDARGVFLGLGPETGPGMLARSVLEGVAYALRATAEGQGTGLEGSGLVGSPLPLLGGGAQSAVWCRILADVFRVPVTVLARPSLLPVLGAAYAAFAHLGWTPSYEAYRRGILGDPGDVTFGPDPERADHHDQQFARFQRLHPAVSSLF